MLNKFINKSIFFIHTSLGTTGSLLHDGSPVVVDVVLLEGGGTLSWLSLSMFDQVVR